MRPLRSAFAAPALAAALAGAVSAGTLGGALLYDDVPDIVRNRFVREHDVVGIFTGPSWATWVGIGDAGFRPVTTLTFTLNHLVHGLEPAGYHAVNVLLHAAATAVLVVVVGGILVRPGAALVAGLLFAVHPVHTEAVAAVVGRADVLSMLFGLGCWWMVRGGGSGAWWTLAGAASLVLALLSKETAVALVGVVALSDLGAGRRTGLREVVRRRWPTWAALAAAAAAALAWRSVVLRGSGGGITPFDNVVAGEPLLARIPTTLAVAARYVEKLVWPVRLSADYSYRQIDLAGWTDPYCIAGALLFVVGGVAGVLSFRRDPDAWSGFVLLAVPLLGVLGLTFLALGPTMAERLLYLPSAGFCVLGAVLLHALAARGRLARRAAWAAVAALLVTGSALTVARNAVWRDPEVFFPTMVADAPRSARAHRELGTFYAETGRTEEAVAALRTSLGIRPNPATAYNLGNVLAGARRYDDAIAAYHLALSLRPDFVEAMANLATSYGEKGDDASAVRWFEQALAARPGVPRFHMNFANTLQRLGRLEDAARHYGVAVAGAPNDAAIRYNYGVCLERLGDLAAAVRQYEAAIAIEPRWTAPHERLIATQLAAGERAAALTALARAESLLPADPTVQRIRRWFASTEVRAPRAEDDPRTAR